MIDLWDESFWLPPNTTWTDIENGPDKAVVYGSARDLLVQAPLAVTILTLRYIFERYVLKPLGKSLNISDKQNRRAPKNDVLEAEYRNLTNLKNLPSLAKKVDMSERQVERWWRLRRSQDKPSTLTKFCENMWKGTFYLVKESCVLVVLLGKKWFWNLDLCLDGHPHQGLTSDIWWYYMISSAFYWALIISQFWDVRRKDFWQMFVHHIATINFLSFSWICNLHRVGSIVLFTHEPSDIFLEFTKAARYAQFHRLAPVLFGTFVLVWIALRLYMFPVLILKPMLFSQPYYFPMFTFLKVLLCILMALNIMWTWFIVKAIFRTSMLGKSPEDTTSSSSENSDDSNVKNNLKTNFLIMIDLWDENFWLPPNTTWSDIENGPDKAVVYGSARDLLVQAPVAVIILTLRYVSERYVLKPLGKSLNISDKQNRRAPQNDVLEAEYRNFTNLKNLPSLAKKVDMSERQVERWWRLRRSQDKPSTLVKFCENMWKGTFYSGP